MTSYELSVLDFIQEHFQTTFGDIVMPMITKLGNGGTLWIFMGLCLLLIPKYRKVGLVVLCALALDVLVCNMILKPTIARIRPFDVNTTVQLLVARPKDFSFPSGHTAASFAAVSALYFSRHWLWKPMLIVAILISYSRLYLYLHFPSDVFAGVLVGILVGFISYKLVTYFTKIFEKKLERC